MNSAIDTLKVMIEADYTGLKTSLNAGLQTIYGFIDEANGTAINWTKILSGSFTPALIATIAGTFALSIEQALNMQSAIQSSTQAAGSTFGNSSDAMSADAENLASATGESATDIATAMGTVGQTFKDTATAQAVLNAVAEEAYIKGTSVTDMATLLVPLFKEWNVNAGDVSQTMADINSSVTTGTIPFQDLITNLTDVGPALRNYTSLADAAGETELTSALPGMDSSSALNDLKVLAEGVQNPLSNVGVMLGNISKTIQTGGIAGGLAEMISKLQGFGSAAQTIGSQWGLTSNTITNDVAQNVKDVSGLNEAWQKQKTTIGSLNDQYNASTTALKSLRTIWNDLMTDLLKFVVPAGLNELNSVLSGIDILVKGINDVFQNGLSKSLKDTASFFSQPTAGGGNVLTTFLQGLFPHNALNGTGGINGILQGLTPNASSTSGSGSSTSFLNYIQQKVNITTNNPAAASSATKAATSLSQIPSTGLTSG
jgi:hypothetical protein